MHGRGRILPLLAATALLLMGGVAVAQQAAPPAAAGDPRPPVAMGRHHGGGQAQMGQRIEGRLAFLKAELNITEAQMPVWNAYADAMRSRAKSAREQHAKLAAGEAPTAAPARLDRAEAMLTQRLAGIQAMRAALTPLYAALNDEQKKTADELIRARPGMRHG